LNCDLTVHYGEDKRLSAQGKNFPFSFLTQWYDYQKSFVNAMDSTKFIQQPVFRDRSSLSLVHIEKKKELIHEDAEIALYGNRIVVNEGQETERVFSFDDLSAVVILGRNKVNLYYGKELYQLKADKRFNGLKYVNFYYRYKNLTTGNEDSDFLGL
jgi:hypothetical protein